MVTAAIEPLTLHLRTHTHRSSRKVYRLMGVEVALALGAGVEVGWAVDTVVPSTPDWFMTWTTSTRSERERAGARLHEELPAGLVEATLLETGLDPLTATVQASAIEDYLLTLARTFYAHAAARPVGVDSTGRREGEQDSDFDPGWRALPPTGPWLTALESLAFESSLPVRRGNPAAAEWAR